MKALIATTCIAVILAAGLFVYRDQQQQSAAAADAKERSLIRLCQQTRPGGKYFGIKAMTDHCRENGYID